MIIPILPATRVVFFRQDLLPGSARGKLPLRGIPRPTGPLYGPLGQRHQPAEVDPVDAVVRWSELMLLRQHQPAGEHRFFLGGSLNAIRSIALFDQRYCNSPLPLTRA
jgi:hypothetical protein